MSVPRMIWKVHAVSRCWRVMVGRRMSARPKRFGQRLERASDRHRNADQAEIGGQEEADQQERLNTPITRKVIRSPIMNSDAAATLRPDRSLRLLRYPDPTPAYAIPGSELVTGF